MVGSDRKLSPQVFSIGSQVEDCGHSEAIHMSEKSPMVPSAIRRDRTAGNMAERALYVNLALYGAVDMQHRRAQISRFEPALRRVRWHQWMLYRQGREH